MYMSLSCYLCFLFLLKSQINNNMPELRSPLKEIFFCLRQELKLHPFFTSRKSPLKSYIYWFDHKTRKACFSHWDFYKSTSASFSFLPKQHTRSPTNSESVPSVWLLSKNYCCLYFRYETGVSRCRFVSVMVMVAISFGGVYLNICHGQKKMIDLQHCVHWKEDVKWKISPLRQD